MGDQKKTGGQKSSDPEVLDGKRREAPKVPDAQAEARLAELQEKARGHAKEETGTKVDARLDRSDLQRDILERELVGGDADTAKLIASLDTRESVERQMPAYKRLELVSYGLLAKIFKGGKQPDDLEFKKLGVLDLSSIPNLNGTEKIAFLTLQEISRNPGTRLYDHIEPKWAGFTEKVFTLYESSPARSDTKSPARKGTVAKTAGEVWKLAKTNKYKIFAAIGVAAAAYGVYRIFFSKKEEKSGSLSSKIGLGQWSSALKIGGGVLLGGLVLGAIFGPKNILKQIDKLFKIPKEKFDQFCTLFKEGHYADAFKSLFEGTDENWNQYKTIAERLSQKLSKPDKPVEISTKTIKSISKVRYSQFMAVGGAVGELKTAVAALAQEIPGVGAFVSNDEDQAKEEATIREYLKANETTIQSLNLAPDASIMEVLAKLNDVKVDAPAAGEAGKDKDEVDVVETVEVGVGKVMGVAKETAADLAESFKDKPAFAALLRKYDGKWTESLLHPFEFINNLLTACNKDGILVAIGAGRVLLWNGYKFVTFTSAETLVDTALTLVQAPFNDDIDAGDAVSTYSVGAVPFVIVGAVIGAATSQGPGWHAALKDAAKGAARGYIFPVEVARLHVAAGQHLYRTGKGKLYDIKVWRGGPSVAPQLLTDQAKFFARISASYDELVAAAKTPGRNLSVKKWWGKYTTARAEKLRTDYLRRFMRAHNELQDALRAQGKPYEVHIAESEVSGESAMKKMKKFLEVNDTSPKPTVGPGGVPPTLDVAPEHLKTEGTGPEAKHSFKFNNETITLTEREIAAKAAELDAANPGKDAKINWDESVRVLAEEKFLTPSPVEGKPNTYKFQGREFTFTPEEIAAKTAKGASEADAVRGLCYEKVLAHVTVEDVKVEGGKYRYKIDGKWMDPVDSPAKAAEIKAKFVAELAKKGISMDFQEFAAKSKVLVHFPVIEKALGTAAAVLMIYHLETAPDKRKALAETAAGFGAFWAGMKLTDWEIGSKIVPNTPGKMLARTVIDIMGGVTIAMGFTEPIGELVNAYFKEIPGSYGASKEMIDIFEKATARSTIRMVARSAERGILKRLVVKSGMKGLSEFMEKKITGVFLKKIGQLAAKQGFKTVLKALGLKGVTAIALLADDATVVGVVDDVVAAGLLAWMAFDIYDIVKLIANAKAVQDEMEKRNGVAITQFRILDPKSRAAMQEKLIPFGLTVERAHELGEQQLFDLLRTIPETAVEIKREGIPGREVWYLKEAEAIGITITDDGGKEIAKISDEDAEELDSALENISKGEPEAPEEGAATADAA